MEWRILWTDFLQQNMFTASPFYKPRVGVYFAKRQFLQYMVREAMNTHRNMFAKFCFGQM